MRCRTLFDTRLYAITCALFTFRFAFTPPFPSHFRSGRRQWQPSPHLLLLGRHHSIISLYQSCQHCIFMSFESLFIVTITSLYARRAPRFQMTRRSIAYTAPPAWSYGRRFRGRQYLLGASWIVSSLAQHYIPRGFLLRHFCYGHRACAHARTLPFDASREPGQAQVS